jgi:hypothetical protein
MGAPSLCVELDYRETMKTKNRKVIYQGLWPGLGEMYNIKVQTGYTTIIVKPGEDLKKRAQETREKFVCKDIALPTSEPSIDRLSAVQPGHFHKAH